MSGSSGNGKLRQWLIEQVDSGKYPGLVWEDRERTVFRIPWKHAGKQDYNRDEDAALFKAWALFKGKYREGIDKPDPPTWKTRLRCALNKSSDFEELVGRSQLDVSEPFKVYRVIPEGTKRAPKSYEKVSTSLGHHNYPFYPPYEPVEGQVCNFLSAADRSWRDFLCEQNSLSDVHFSQNSRWDTDVTVMSAEGCRLAPHDDNWTFSGPGGPELVPLPQVEPLFVRQLLLLLQQGGVNYMRSTHELCPLTPEQVYPAHQDNPVISGHQTHGNFIQE
ncbi:hypothetical protein cypCar_00041001 [Cyprinus carpio]|nr:hypothetical protein cypCar_00041001 [Cyprinus carpio]